MYPSRLLALLFFLCAYVSACEHDYTVMTREPKVVYEQVEVPVYIEVEVPTGTPVEEVEIWVDSLIQVRAVDGVDIMWVIDTSGSMTAYQTQLLAGIEHMMNALPESGWRLVMISTDPEEVVNESQFPLVPGDSILDAEDMYSLMQTGPDEMGFDSVVAYMETNPYAASWMRPDAALLVVFVSDEDDQSDLMSAPADFVSWYTARRYGNVYLASIVMQEDDVSVCDAYTAGSQPGLAYMEATNMLFGAVLDICAEDWATGVSDATSQIEPYEFIELTHTPVVDTIRVFIDGNLNYDWYYVHSTNTVHFDVIPPGGSLVEVGYVISST